MAEPENTCLARAMQLQPRIAKKLLHAEAHTCFFCIGRR